MYAVKKRTFHTIIILVVQFLVLHPQTTVCPNNIRPVVDIFTSITDDLTIRKLEKQAKYFLQKLLDY